MPNKSKEEFVHSECASHNHNTNEVHSHDENCSCGHCHHEHDETQHHHENNTVSVTNHEGAIVGTLTSNSDIGYANLKEKCYIYINELKDWALSEKYLIGHIKGYVESAEYSCVFSTTGHDITITESTQETSGNNNFNIVCILLGITEEILKNKLNTYAI